MKGKFKQHTLDAAQQQLSTDIRDVASLLDDLLDKVPMNREVALAKTKLEECVMWANKGIALGGTK